MTGFRNTAVKIRSSSGMACQGGLLVDTLQGAMGDKSLPRKERLFTNSNK